MFLSYLTDYLLNGFINDAFAFHMVFCRITNVANAGKNSDNNRSTVQSQLTRFER